MANTQIIETLVNGLGVNPDKSDLPVIMVGDRVLMEWIIPEKLLSESANIVKPENYKEPNMRGIIRSLGGGEYGVPIPESLKVGLTVLYWHQGAIEFVLDSDKKKVYHLIRASDIFLIL